MLQTSIQDKTKSAYFTLKGLFNFNQTPLYIMGTKALVYIDPEVRASWEPHALDMFYVERCKKHYMLLEFWINKTQNYRTTGTYKIYPAHCDVSTL